MTSIWFYAPNLVGYARLLLLGVACYYMPSDPWITLYAYFFSSALDAVDGWLARRLQQSSQFGAVLDMLTDRSATACLQVYIATRQPQYLAWIQLLIVLDFCSHYAQQVATHLLGAGSHKSMQHGWLMRQYYGRRSVLFTLCAMNELCWMGAYLMLFTGDEWVRAGTMGMAAGAAVKQCINVVQLVNACRAIVGVEQQQQQQQQQQLKRKQQDDVKAGVRQSPRRRRA